ncbi:HIT domain-containing protein [Granulicella sp. WH15]|uniref:HIT family protein n=1 Tax=Granulicella sp. WH15 TaxID=2602070 RepID=UPI0013671DFD|nr:HIT domain-containing protein [Granulicella sp. WH15]QHN02067.1 HIT domain-containing protein [Granulicella sp. WH15]
MDRLWTPWRYSYITGADSASNVDSDKPSRPGVPRALAGWPEENDHHCVFCNLIGAVEWAISSGMSAEEAERAGNVILRGPHTFTCLNAFPYSSGHVLIVPYRHVASLAELDEATAGEIILTAQRLETALRGVYRPDGINMGLNLGQAAGAGVAGHVHMHVLPRWFGDTNFMTVTAETRVLPELLEATWNRLREELARS